MLYKISHSFTPSPYGYSPCLGESADDYVECIHCLSLRLLAQAAAFGQRPKGSVKPTALSPGQGDEHEVRRGWRVNWTTVMLLQKKKREACASRFVGKDGFEPPKSKDSRFTVCPIWPLWNLPRHLSAHLHLRVLKLCQRANKACFIFSECSQLSQFDCKGTTTF